MKRVVIVLVAFIAGAMTVVSSTHGQRNQSPLMEPYVPTRLEWLAVDLESRFKADLSGGANISTLDFTAIAPDTVLVTVMYTNEASAAIVDAVVEQAKGFVNQDALSYGWSKWVKIRVERKHL